MRIINTQVEKDLEQGKAIKLDLGSGGVKRQGIYGVDCLELENVDIVADLNKPLNLFPDNCVDSIYSFFLINEIQ